MFISFEGNNNSHITDENTEACGGSVVGPGLAPSGLGIQGMNLLLPEV